MLTLSLVDDSVPDEPPTKLTVTATADAGRPGSQRRERVVLLGPNPRPLGSAELVTPAELSEGLAVVALDRAPAPAVDDDPPLRLTVELPFPLSTADVDLWGQGLVGTTPVAMSGGVSLRQVEGDQAVVWQLTHTSRAFLERVLPSCASDRQMTE